MNQVKRPGRGATEKADRKVADRAEKQHGAIAGRQALEAGPTRAQIRRRRRSGRWRDTAVRDVYALGGTRDTWHLAAIAAVLAGPPGTVASHLTAAALLDAAKAPEPPHVTVPPSANGRYRGAVVHRSALDSVDICVAANIRCTGPARTLVDCAAILSHDALCELVDQMLFRHSDARRVREAMRRAGKAPGRKGLPSLEEALAVWTPGPRPGSPGEMRLVRWLRRHGFPLPERQWKVYGAEGELVGKIDLAWPQLKVGLEYDGGEFHGPRRWLADAERQEGLETLGWRIGRATKYDLEPGATALETWLAPLVPRALAS